MGENINIESFQKLETPEQLKAKLPNTPQISNFIDHTRQEIRNILDKKDKRLLCIIGPCSIHNIDEALEYGKQLKKLADKVKDKLLIVMRVYFEKPRTTIGWKGLINDPYLDGSCHVNYGLYIARRLLVDLNQIGIPCGYEILDTITPQYIADLMSWGAIGARTTESQVHRQLISGVSMPIGFKNGTSGNIKVAADAILSAEYTHCFMGITEKGEAAICKTLGNKYCHIILRGGTSGPNYFEKNIKETAQYLRDSGVKERIMVDCSHGNSRKDHTLQPVVMENIIKQATINPNIIGIMMESNIHEGNQKIKFPLQPGVSITDACLSIEDTEKYITQAYNILSAKL